jgi:glycosyltransferase involved in cell wall biosynthesis
MELIRVAILADIPVEALTGEATGRGGGQASTWLPQLAGAFENSHADLDITWIRIKPKSNKLDDRRIGRQRYITLPGISSRIDFWLRNQPSRYQLRRILRNLKPDLIHTWGTEKPYSSVLGDFDGPSLLSVQGCLAAFIKVTTLPLHLRIASGMEPARVRTATRVTCESLWSAEQTNLLNPRMFPDVVDYGVHPRFYQAVWRPDRELPYLLYSGSIDHRKGFDLLLAALEQIPDRRWELRVLGDGPLRAAGEAMNLPNVRWLGSQPWNRMIPEMEKAWGLVVPTRADTGPTVVKEARVIGLPVIASNHGGLRDYIQGDLNGIKVDPLNAQNLASAMIRIMSDFDATVRLGEGNHAADRERFQPQHTADQFARIYREMIAAGRR